MMILFSLLFGVHISTHQLTAFRQDVRKGIPTIGTDADGQLFISNNDETNYYLYLESDVVPQIQEVWIDGQAYTFRLAEITTPVVIKTGFDFKNGLQKHVLASPGSRPVYRIIIGTGIQTQRRKGIDKGVHLFMQDRTRIDAVLVHLPDAFGQ